jgi:brefeldin A-inhibited guanine nucleotide-exchange protein
MQRKRLSMHRMKRNAEQNFELGAVKFTLSLKSGLNFFIDNDFVERDAKAICPLHNKQKDTLDKTQMGEVL